MRVILISVLGGFLLCLAGCEGSERVEIPKNPTPPPKNIVPMSSGGAASMPAPKVTHPVAAPGKRAP